MDQVVADICIKGVVIRLDRFGRDASLVLTGTS